MYKCSQHVTDILWTWMWGRIKRLSLLLCRAFFNVCMCVGGKCPKSNINMSLNVNLMYMYMSLSEQSS